MKFKIIFLLGLILLSGNIFSRNIQAFLSYCIFYSPESGPYIETYLAVNNNTVTFVKNENGKFQASVDIALIFKKNDVVESFKRYKLMSQEVEDTSNLPLDFIDQQRISLEAGSYLFEVSITDANNPDQSFEATDFLEVKEPGDQLLISDIQLVDTYKKSENSTQLTKVGYDMIPFVYGFYPENRSKLTFYAETYNSDGVFGNEGMFLVNIYIESYETGQKMSTLIKTPSREKTAVVLVHFDEFDITMLPSGNYNLVIEARDRENKLISRKAAFFQRFNPGINIALDDIASLDIKNTFVIHYKNVDTLKEFIRCLEPISSELEKIFSENQLEKGDLLLMQQYLYNFWHIRDPLDPVSAWNTYLIEVQKVDVAFSTKLKRGWETDRGGIYLKYGEPNNIFTSPHEPLAYPYDIWQYYRIPPNQTNKKFVFINYDMVTNDYELAHSNAVGELNDPQWHLRLHDRASNIETNVDRTEYDTHYGSQALERFNNPY